LLSINNAKNSIFFLHLKPPNFFYYTHLIGLSDVANIVNLYILCNFVLFCGVLKFEVGSPKEGERSEERGERSEVKGKSAVEVLSS